LASCVTGDYEKVALILPEGCELVASIKLHCVYWYYEIVQTAMLAELRGFMLILCVHSGTVKRHFSLFKAAALPACISSKNYAWFKVDKTILR
jgi:hypothetical protein